MSNEESGPFDWNKDVDSVVFPTVQGVAVYSNPDGDIVIRQQAGPLDDDDTIIVFPRSQAQSIALAIQVTADARD